MEGPLPSTAAEAQIRDATGSGALRTTIYGVLAALLLAGAWVRFNPEIAAFAPVLAGPAADVAARMAAPGRMKGVVELGLLPLSATAEAVAAMGLPAGDAAALTQDVRRGRLRLVRLPLFDLSPILSAPEEAGRAIAVSAGGYTRVVRLTREPVSVTLPVGPVGIVSFSNLNADMIDIGALTLAGPARMPGLPAERVMEVEVIAQ